MSAQLFLYVSDKSVTGMVQHESGDVTYHMFPFKYSHVLSGYGSEEMFYKGVVSVFCKEAGVKITDTKIFIGGEISREVLGDKFYFAGDTFSIIKNISTYKVYSIGDSTFYIGSKMYGVKNAHTPVSNKIDTEDLNNSSNQLIYPQMVHTDIVSQVSLDRDLLNMYTYFDQADVSELPVIFLGQRFVSGFSEPESNYLLILSFLQTPGVYDVFIDEFFSIMLHQIAQISGYAEFSDSTYKIKKALTVISSTGAIECLLKSNIGTSQLIELGIDKLFTVPVLSHESINVSVKSHDLGNIERRVEGGEIGVLFDTRVNKSDLLTNIKVFNEGLKVFSRALASI